MPTNDTIKLPSNTLLLSLAGAEDLPLAGTEPVLAEAVALVAFDTDGPPYSFTLAQLAAPLLDVLEGRGLALGEDYGILFQGTLINAPENKAQVNLESEFTPYLNFDGFGGGFTDYTAEMWANRPTGAMGSTIHTARELQRGMVRLATFNAEEIGDGGSLTIEQFTTPLGGALRAEYSRVYEGVGGGGGSPRRDSFPGENIILRGRPAPLPVRRPSDGSCRSW